MTIAEAIAAETRGEGSLRFDGGRPYWTTLPVRFPAPSPGEELAEVARAVLRGWRPGPPTPEEAARAQQPTDFAAVDAAIRDARARLQVAR